MNPATIALIIGLVEQLIAQYPTIRADLQNVFAKDNPTPQDWLDLKAKVLAQTFESLAPDAKTIPDEPQAPV